MKTVNILVASSRPEMRTRIRSVLALEGHLVAESGTADAMVGHACSERFELLVADGILDGIPTDILCRTIRAKSDLRILVFDSENGTNAIDALQAGADDYVTGPLVMEELAARVRAILRRLAGQARRQIVLHDRSIDLDSHKVNGPDGRVTNLTPKEFQVLDCLLARADQPRTYHSLAQTVWQRNGEGEREYIRIVVKQLRRKLEPDPDNPQYILTERSVGYRFHMPLHAASAY